MVLSLKFHDPYPPLHQDPIFFLENFPYTLPDRYIELLKKHDGGFVDYCFTYYSYDCKRVIRDGIAVLFGLNHKYNLIKQYYYPPEFFPKNLVSFAENGGGNFICFDYRHNQKTNNPPIVYWEHEAEEGKDVSFLANNFDEFINILKEPEDSSLKSDINKNEFNKWKEQFLKKVGGS